MKRFSRAIVAVLAIATILVFAPKKPSAPVDIPSPEAKLAEKQAPADHFFLQRSYPDMQMDLQAYEAALQSARISAATHKTQSTRITNTPWTLEGPGNIGGRINAIAIDPNNSSVILAGCAAGGIFKTTDAGLSWNPVFDAAAHLAIGDITYEPGNSQVIYAGTGDPNISGYPVIGDGIYKSTDGGQTWNNMGLSATRIISRIIVDPNNVNKVYAATMGLPMQRNNDRGLYVSTDAGNTWSQSLFVADQAGIIDLVMDPSNTQILYASSWDRIRTNQESTTFGTNAKVWRTSDGGANWTALSGGLPSSSLSRVNLSIDASNPSTVYACYVDTTYNVYNIYKTTNSGSNWTPMDISTLGPGELGGFGWYFGNIFVNPYQTNELYLLGVQLWRTTDNGTTWAEADPAWWTYDVHADKHDMVFTGANSFYLATDGGMYYTSDDGTSWVDAEFIPNTQFYRVQVNPHQPGVYFGGAQDNGTMSGNAAAINSWPRIYGGDGFQVLFTANSQEMIAETQNGNLVYSQDGGYSFNGFNNGIDTDDRRNWDMPVAISEISPTIFYTGTYRVYRTSGPLATQNWQAISPDLTDGIVFHRRFHTISTVTESPMGVNVIYAGTSDGNVHVSTNAGSSWTNISTGLPKRYVTSVKASPRDINEVLVTVSGYKYNDFIPHVLRSTDQGANWVDVSGDLPQLALNDVLFHPTRDSVWAVASDGGVYITQNYGQNWLRIGNNMPMIPVYDMEWDLAGSKLIAGTHARSMMSFPMDSLVTGDVIIGVSMNLDKDLVKVYPNPATERLNLDFGTETAEWTVLDLQGRALLQGSYAGQRKEISVDRLPAGSYLLRVVAGDKVATQQFVKQ